MTLLLSRTDLERLLDVDDCLAALRAGFVAAPAAVAAQRVRTALPGPGTATALVPGLLDGAPAYTVKVNAKFPGASPALRGVVCLHDLATGELLALLDSATVTAWRTGLAAALGTHALARPDADPAALAVIGAGAQAELTLRGLLRLRRVRELTVHDTDPARASAFATRHGAAPGVVARVVDDPRAAARAADVTLTATWSRAPFLHEDDIAPGCHVTSLGADEPGKAELSPGLLEAARVVVDDPELATAGGALRDAGPAVRRSAVTLSDVLRGTAVARRVPDEVTAYAPVGLPWQDLALALSAYERARRLGAGTPFDFLA